VHTSDDRNARLNAEIRRRAGYGAAEQPHTGSTEGERQDKPPDFGAGAGRQTIQPQPSMSDLIRAAYYGEWRQHPMGGS
jgi:hypothetical protein